MLLTSQSNKHFIFATHCNSLQHVNVDTEKTYHMVQFKSLRKSLNWVEYIQNCQAKKSLKIGLACGCVRLVWSEEAAADSGAAAAFLLHMSAAVSTHTCSPHTQWANRHQGGK